MLENGFSLHFADKCGNWMSMIANWFSSPSLPHVNGELHTYCFKSEMNSSSRVLQQGFKRCEWVCLILHLHLGRNSHAIIMMSIVLVESSIIPTQWPMFLKKGCLIIIENHGKNSADNWDSKLGFSLVVKLGMWI